MRAAVLLIGDELLGGVVRDANLTSVARALGARGVPVVCAETVGDAIPEIVLALLRLAPTVDLLVATGGLGPTEDDRTRAAFAQALGVVLERDEDVGAKIVERARKLGHPAPEMVLRQAERPSGTEWIVNPVGSAPGFRGILGHCFFWVLPGVPSEVEAMLSGVVALLPEPPPDLEFECIVATAGLSEVRAALALEERGFMPPEGADLGFLPSPTGVRIKLASRGGVPRSAMALAESRIREALAEHALHVGPLERAVVEIFHRRGCTLSSAESCTGGLLGARITDVPGASSVYLGGIVAYANQAKSAILGVSTESLAAHGAVSEATARGMAEGCRRRFDSTVAISITGVAGPGGGTPTNPVGSVWIGLADADGSQAQHFVFGGNRAMIRERSVGKSLEWVWRHIQTVKPA